MLFTIALTRLSITETICSLHMNFEITGFQSLTKVLTCSTQKNRIIKKHNQLLSFNHNDKIAKYFYLSLTSVE